MISTVNQAVEERDRERRHIREGVAVIVGSATISGDFIVHWIITTALMLVIYLAIRHALKED